ncbi:MAG: hypothetical protein ACJAQ1_000144 [Flavobacterium sp.]
MIENYKTDEQIAAEKASLKAPLTSKKDKLEEQKKQKKNKSHLRKSKEN